MLVNKIETALNQTLFHKYFMELDLRQDIYAMRQWGERDAKLAALAKVSKNNSQVPQSLSACSQQIVTTLASYWKYIQEAIVKLTGLGIFLHNAIVRCFIPMRT